MDNTYWNKVVGFIGSRGFLVGTLIFFVVQGLWVALSSVYPMAFDEDYHLGVIQLYAHHWSPFLTSQPAGADIFGAVYRDPSYLYHYFMSFPYRLLSALTDSQTIQVIGLRVINVALFTAGLVLFARLLRRAGLSPALRNLALFLGTMVPVACVLAGQINYDNLLFPLVAWAILWTFDCTDALRKRRIPLAKIAGLAALCMLACLVKYAFLPICLALVVWLVYVGIKQFRGQGVFRHQLVASYKKIHTRAKWSLALLLVLSAGLFFQRYGINTIAYKNPVPSCDAVMSVQRCSAYSPWARNYTYAATKADHSYTHNPVLYLGMWLYWLWYRLFFVVNGPASDFTNYPPMPLPSETAAIVFVAGVFVLLYYRRKVLARNAYLPFLLLLILTYMGVLWLQNYQQYLETGQPVAINGRYVLPVLLPMAVLFAHAANVLWRKRPHHKLAAAVVVLALFVQGGGVLSFILRSDASWNWPNSPAVTINNGARTVLAPFVIEGSKYY